MVNKALANKERRYVCNVFSQQLRPCYHLWWLQQRYLDCNAHVAYMGPTWVLSAPGEPHVGPINSAIRVPA